MTGEIMVFNMLPTLTNRFNWHQMVFLKCVIWQKLIKTLDGNINSPPSPCQKKVPTVFPNNSHCKDVLNIIRGK